jgi:hypothetical protein
VPSDLIRRVPVGGSVASTWEIEHDRALAERDAALHQVRDAAAALLVIHYAIVLRFGQDAWSAVAGRGRLGVPGWHAAWPGA